MITLMLRGLSGQQLEIYRETLEHAQDYFGNHFCMMYLCTECPARRVCKDIRNAVNFVDEYIANRKRNS